MVERAENRLPDWLYDLHPVSGIDLIVASVLMAMGMMMLSPRLFRCPLN